MESKMVGLRRSVHRGLLAAIFMSAVAACGDDGTAAPPAHPRLECVGEENDFNPPDSLDISGPGGATADSALRTRLESVIEGLGAGEIVALSDTEYGVAVDGRIVFIQRAVTNRDGDWHATDSFYCSKSESGEQLVLADSE